MVAEEIHTLESPTFRKNSSKRKRSSQSRKSPQRLTFDQQIDRLPEFKPPVLLASSAMSREYLEKAKEFIDTNIMFFESQCYFHPKINEKSKQMSRARSSTNVFEDLYVKSRQKQAE